MRICKKCGNKFPYRIKTDDGKVHCIPERSYCFVCSPFGSTIKIGRTGNPTTEIKNDTTHRICSKCKQSKEENNNNFYKRYRGGFFSYCKTCSNKDIADRIRQIKLKSIEYKGGKCIVCGYDKCVRSLDFHHLTPSEKDFSISDRHTHDFKKIKIELDKCVLLCKNCHGELHSDLITI
jgi:hypothetical protein